MHVLIVVLHRPLKPTGVCRHAANLARCLADLDNVSQITLVTGAWQKDYFETAFSLSSCKIRIIGVDIKNSSTSRNFWFLFSLPKLVKQLDPSIVHLSFPLPFLRSRFPCPVVATIHDLYPYQFPENFGYHQVLFNRLFLKQCVYSSDGLSCVSKVTLNDLKAYFPKLITLSKKTRVIYNFVDFDKTEPVQPKGIFEDGNTSYILSVGQHRKNKNLDILIQAFAYLIQGNRLSETTKLLLVGSPGPETDSLLQLIQTLSIEKSVLMLSSINDQELSWLYQNCQLFVMPSSVEGFCLPLVEALYFSCKVVCSDIPIFREVGSSSCTYFSLREDRLESLEKAMTTALKSAVPKRTDVHLKFSSVEVSERLLEFYSELI